MTTDMIIAAARAELAALQLRRLLTSPTAQDAEARRLEREFERQVAGSPTSPHPHVQRGGW